MLLGATLLVALLLSVPMLTLAFGRVPATGDIVDWHGWRFEIVDMDKHRIDKVLASRLPGAGDIVGVD